MIKAALLVAAVATPAALAAGMWAGENSRTPATIVIAGRQNAPLVTKPGWGVAGAAHYFAELNAPPPPPPPVRQVVFTPPPPPPPDVGLLLRRDVTAVLGGADGADMKLALSGGRRLGHGEVYRDGWTLTGLTGQTATLTKANEQKTVNLFSPLPSAETTQLASAPTLGPISFSNSQRPGVMSAGQISQLLTVLRQGGTSEAQLNQLRQTLQSGQQIPPNQLMQLLMTAGRGRPGAAAPVSPAQINALVGNLANSGLVTQQQATQISQNLNQMGNNQVNQIINQMQQPPRPGGGAPAGPNAGFNTVPARPAPPQPAPPPTARPAGAPR